MPDTDDQAELPFPFSVTHARGRYRRRDDPLRRCAKIASVHFGIIRRDQALSAGLTERQIDHRIHGGEWLLLYPAVYALRSWPATWEQAVLAAVFRGGPHAVASGACSASLHGFPGFRHTPVEISTPRKLKRPPFTCHVRVIEAKWVTRVRGVPTTKASRTLLDIAQSVSQPVLEAALDDCLRRRLTTFLELGCLLGGVGKGVHGTKALRQAVTERGDGKPIPESVLESRLWRPLKAAGGPAPERQYPVEYSGKKYRIDFAFPHAKVAIEAQSFLWHNERSAWQVDLEKSNALVALGWKLLQVTWDDLDDDVMLEQLRELLLPGLF